VDIPGYSQIEDAGRGEFDDRYRAVADDGSVVALRVLRGNTSDARLTRRLERELSAAERIGPVAGVVQVLASGTTDDGTAYLVTEWAGGGSLGDHLAATGALPVDEVLRLGRQLAGGLAAAHDAGVLHRDLTPDSVLLTDDGDAKLTGFGVSAMEGGQATEALSFTPVHTAPEVVEGKEPTEATDVYQLASVLYTALAGQPPFGTKADGTMAVLNRILADPPPPFARDDVPPELAALLNDAMTKDPAARSTTASMMAIRLDALTAAAAPPAPTPPPAPPAPPAAAPPTPPAPTPPLPPAATAPAPPAPTAPAPSPPTPPAPTAPAPSPPAPPAPAPPAPPAPAPPAPPPAPMPSPTPAPIPAPVGPGVPEDVLEATPSPGTSRTAVLAVLGLVVLAVLAIAVLIALA